MTQATHPSTEMIWSWLDEIADPEIPVISITDLGIVRSVSFYADQPDHCSIEITPTYSGCPATEVIADQIRQTLGSHGVRSVDIRIQLAPPWSTTWLTERGLEAMRRFGIAPPSQAPSTLTQITLKTQHDTIACPLCGSGRTEVLSHYGATPCKSLHRCLDCREPFDHFKPH